MWKATHTHTHTGIYTSLSLLNWSFFLYHLSFVVLWQTALMLIVVIIINSVNLYFCTFILNFKKIWDLHAQVKVCQFYVFVLNNFVPAGVCVCPGESCRAPVCLRQTTGARLLTWALKRSAFSQRREQVLNLKNPSESSEALKNTLFSGAIHSLTDSSSDRLSGSDISQSQTPPSRWKWYC